MGFASAQGAAIGFGFGSAQGGGSGFAPAQGTGSAASSLLTSLVAYYKLDEASGTRADSSGNVLTLSDNNTVTGNPGKVATAAQFTVANNEWLSRADEALIRTGNVDFTVAGWLFMDTLPAATDLISKWGGTTNEFTLEILSAGTQFIMYVRDTGAPAVSTVAAAAGAWFFCVGGYNAATGKAFISVNNETLVEAVQGANTVGTSALNIGGLAGAGSANGRIDEVGFWKSAAGGGGVLSAAQRTALYNLGVGATYPFTGIP